MRSLYVSYLWPWGLPTGGRRRMAVTADALAGLGPVDLFVIGPAEPPGPPPPDTPFTRVAASIDPPSGRARTAMAALTRGTVAHSAVPERRRACARLARWSADTAYDLVWFGSEALWLRTRGVVPAPCVIDVDDLHDDVHTHWLRLGITEDGRRLSLFRRVEARRGVRWWRSVHARAAREADALVFASDADRVRIPVGKAISMTLPNTYPMPVPAPVLPHSGGHPPTLLLQGLLTYRPNVDAALWLVQEILPFIHARRPDVRVVLGGRAAAEVRRLADHPHVEVTGFVPDMAELLRRADLVVVPLRVGGGTRIKILEAFAHRIPVVSTRTGVEGIDVRAGEHIELADDPETFAAACLRVLADPERARRMADAAHRLYLDRHRTEHGTAQVHAAVRAVTGTACTERAR